MNVVITLPVNLIAEILEGRKKFEIRSRIPLKFDNYKDVVYVVQKGTKKVVLYFTIAKIFGYYNLNSDADFVASRAAVPTGWLKSYAAGKTKIYAWVIGCWCKLTDCSEVYQHLGIKSNPQSFVYTGCEWRQFRISHYRWNSQLSRNLKSQQLDPINERDMWLTYNKKAVQ